MIDTIGSIDLAYSSGGPRIVRIPEAIGKVNTQVDASERVSVRKLGRELRVSPTNIHRILEKELKYHSYKKRIQSFLTGAHKVERKALANWIHTNFRKEQTMRIFFSDQKNFDIDEVYNLQNDRVWTPSRSEANKRNGIVEKRKFPDKSMMWLRACSMGISP